MSNWNVPLAKPSFRRLIYSGCGVPRSAVDAAVRVLHRVLLVLVLFAPTCFASEVVYVETKTSPAASREQVHLAARFYGLAVEDISIMGKSDVRSVLDAIKRPDTLAAIVSEDALSKFSVDEMASALRRPGRTNVSLLILLDHPDASGGLLARWSGGDITNCEAVASGLDAWKLNVAVQKDIARELAGLTLPLYGQPSCGLVVGAAANSRVIADVSASGKKLPVFIESRPGKLDAFFTSVVLESNDTLRAGTLQRTQSVVASIATLLMFLRNSAGDRAWHSVAHYANLTVDDAWLTEPFGNLDYAALLEQMEKHNFHTTIAFIPWNFDRSKPEVVSLFRDHPDRYSISVHGNNHDHREFGDYAHQPLGGQVVNLKQALARMDQFTKATGIPYDRVMIFPHAVAPAQTFIALKEYNYWATTNSEVVPLGSRAPEDPLFSLRPQALEYANFLSISRYSAEYPISAESLAVNAYLGNTILFYAHEGYFHRGINVFNEVADTVNRIDRDTKWASLGSVIQHMYLIRSRQDQDYDVLAYSPNFILTNPGKQTALFHVRKPENFVPGIASIKVDDQDVACQDLKNEIAFDVPIEPGQSRLIKIVYANDLGEAQIDVSKKSFYINLIRRISDFRDLALSRNKFGWDFMDFYYSRHLDDLERTLEPWVFRFVLILVLALGMAIAYRWRTRAAAHRSGDSFEQ